MKNKIFTRIIITTLLCAFLTFNVGKVTRVSAVGTTIAASAAAALCAVGIVYCSYMALTGASVHVPDSVENIETWLKDMGTKVVQYPSGRAAYEEIYPNILGPGQLLHDFLDSEIWTWTSEKLKLWANDFSSVDVMQQIATFEQSVDISTVPLNGFDYSFAFSSLPTSFVLTTQNNAFCQSYADLAYYGYAFTLASGKHVIVHAADQYFNVPTTITQNVRNYLTSTGKYKPQYFNGSTWVNYNTLYYSVGTFTNTLNRTYDAYIGDYQNDIAVYKEGGSTVSLANELDYPFFPNDVIYDSVNDRDLPLVIPQSTEVVRNPQYPTLPPEDDNKPVIPYLKLPFDPSWVDPVTGLPGGGNWGFNLAQLLDALEDLAGLLMEIGAIGDLINQFKDLINGQLGDEYYIYYDDSTNNYYQYYTITNFGDNIYNYDIDVSEADEHLPVDLNTIQTYSSNRYLEQIKQSAINGSSIVRDFAVFWYDVDPEVTYIALGICILILIGAFTGKLGHS